MHLCGMLGCIQGERNPECPYIEPELLHIGLTVVTAPADRAPPSSSALLFLSCPPDEAVALPLIYLLRAKLSADPAFAAYRVEVLPPDVELTLEQELQTFQQARSSHWAAEGELDRYPASCRTDLSNLLQWLHGRVAWEFRRLLHTSTAQLEAAGLPAPQHACLPSPPSRLQADVKRPFVTAEMQWRIASGRNRAAEDVVRVVKGAVDRKETLEEPRVPGLRCAVCGCLSRTRLLSSASAAYQSGAWSSRGSCTWNTCGGRAGGIGGRLTAFPLRSGADSSRLRSGSARVSRVSVWSPLSQERAKRRRRKRKRKGKQGEPCCSSAR